MHKYFVLDLYISPMTQPSHHSIARLLPSPFFCVWLAAFFCSLLWFDIEWCAFTSFRPFKAYISLYAFLPAAACLLAIPALTTRRWYIPAIWLLLIDMLLVANLMYARTYMVQIPLESYLIASNLKGFEGAVIESLRWGDIGFLLIIAASIFFARKYAPKSKPMRGWPLASFAAVTLLFCAGAYTTLALRGGFVKRLAKMRSSATDQMTITPVYTPFSVMLYDFMSLDKPISDSEKKLVAQWLKEHKSITDSYSPSESAPKSLIVILCESLESWPIGMSIEGKEITPFLNSLVADSATYFNPNVLTQVKDGRSIDAQLLYLGIFIK